MRQVILASLIMLLLSGVAVAVYEAGYGGYSGVAGRERRLYDPFSRDQYFGEGYTKPYVNYGSKGPTYRVTNTGAKSAYSSVFNLDTNAYTSRGRDPAKISNHDPNVRGYGRIDEAVDLLPYSPVEQSFDDQPTISKGTARIVSSATPYGSDNSNKAAIRSSIYIHLQDLPPLGENEIYEAWLLDEDSEYALSLGLVTTGQQFTGYLSAEIARLLLPFDAVMITREPFPDLDPNPNGEIYLYGYLDDSRTKVAPPTSYFPRLR